MLLCVSYSPPLSPPFDCILNFALCHSAISHEFVPRELEKNSREFFFLPPTSPLADCIRCVVLDHVHPNLEASNVTPYSTRNECAPQASC